MLFEDTHYIPPPFEHPIFYNSISSFSKELLEFIESEAMIVPWVRADLDIVVTISTMTRSIARLFAEIPVGHIHSTSFSEKGPHIAEHPESRLMRLEVVEGGEEEERVEGLESWNLGGLEGWRVGISERGEWAHITHFEIVLRMQSLRFIDHPSRAIDPEVADTFHFTLFTFHLVYPFMDKPPIPTTNIKYTRWSMSSHIRYDIPELWPVEIFATFRECLGILIVGHCSYSMEEVFDVKKKIL